MPLTCYHGLPSTNPILSIHLKKTNSSGQKSNVKHTLMQTMLPPIHRYERGQKSLLQDSASTNSSTSCVCESCLVMLLFPLALLLGLFFGCVFPTGSERSPSKSTLFLTGACLVSAPDTAGFAGVLSSPKSIRSFEG
jgi:hypothetical protein